MKPSAPTLTIALSLLVAACATTPVPSIKTPSGRPECMVSGATSDEVQEYVLERLMAKGWTLNQQTPSQLVLWMENTSMVENALLGSRYDPTTTYELRLVFAKSSPSDVRVFGQLALVTNEGSAFEQRNDLTSSAMGYELWQSLTRVEAHFKQVQLERTQDS